MKKTQTFIALVFVFASLHSAQAEVSLSKIRWGFRQGAKVSVRASVFQESDQWAQPPASKVLTMPRIMVTLINRGPTPAEGVVLRYAISARIVSVKNPGGKGTWVVPIWVDRRRVAFLKPNQVLDVQIDPSAEMRLTTSIKEMFRSGFWPNALNIQVMVEPRLGEDIKGKISEKQLPVIWQSSVK